MNRQPEIQVGILAEKVITFELDGHYDSREEMNGLRFRAELSGEEIVIISDSGQQMKGKEFIFQASSVEDSFLLEGVTIGIDFHWEQKENQRFRGDLKLIVEGGKVRAINLVLLEEYLRSVISSEMSATSSSDLLKAHAVISRSWLLAQINKSEQLKSGSVSNQSIQETEGEMIRWYDREDHRHFDVCSDDHCQRYQGITKIVNEKASRSVDDTFGEFLILGDEICDARFSKCCGGMSENFENVWQPVAHSYLSKVFDSEYSEATGIDLRREGEAEEWIRSSPDAFCNTNDKQILSQVLPDFDQATTDFYRWRMSYTQEQLSSLLLKKTGIDFGQVIRLEPVERGHSSRLIKLRIVGVKRTMIIGKELEIRRALSESHLYSSAFVVDYHDVQGGIPQQIELSGAGWGHGVGLCQIGAAVMGEKGYDYQSILKHYFKGAELKKIY
ncbi:SpoIID/LytB domain-containing protein [uncultured Sunxiuqinia sp.]|uniref:SpoIID/LytB domain-containing protein n=1 Tax=uncultured Sunxiuqinia sp. TaxID=1573825 RepID=UPI0030DC2719|tara:strand:- start:23871 stop:25202 length:1332 start_codon:yes stop_codon:yes gene_type:complete